MKTRPIGLDAARLPVLDPLFEEGELETLRSPWESVASWPHESQIPPWSATAWPSLEAATSPGTHGVYGLPDFDGYCRTVVDATDVRTRPNWGRHDVWGRSSVAVTVPGVERRRRERGDVEG